MKNSLAASCKVKIHLAYNPTILLLYVHPKAMKTYVHVKAYSQKFITTLCIPVKFGNDPMFIPW